MSDSSMFLASFGKRLCWLCLNRYTNLEDEGPYVEGALPASEGEGKGKSLDQFTMIERGRGPDLLSKRSGLKDQ